MTRPKWLWIGLLVALMLAAVVFVASHTEWVEEEVTTPASGEARHNRYYAVQQLLRQLGGQVRQRTHLQDMPPRHARLWLDSYDWNMLEDRSDALRQWVDAGGHLVISADMAVEDDALDWIPIRWEREEEEGKENAPPPNPREPDPECIPLSEPDGVEPYYVGDSRGFSFCRHRQSDAYAYIAEDDTLPLWVLDSPHGTEIARARYGKGTVTAIANGTLFGNYSVLRGDHALLAAAKRPLLLLGGCNWSEAGRTALQHFAEASSIPSICAFRYQDQFDNHSPVFCGEAGVGMPAHVRQLISEADVLLAVNVRFGEMTTDAYTLLQCPNPQQKVIHVHASDLEIGKVYQPTLGIHA